MIDQRAILTQVLSTYALPIWGHHGLSHWARVQENALRLVAAGGGDAEVVTLFALFHDSRRRNEHQDAGHGRRGGEFARTLRGTLVNVSDAQFELLFEACRLHTRGLTSADPTLGACWDADRLDLGRVGIDPDPGLLSTAAARELLPWADARAVRAFKPRELLGSWGY